MVTKNDKNSKNEEVLPVQSNTKNNMVRQISTAGATGTQQKD